MGKKWIVISSLVVLILLFLGYIASQMVHVTGPVIWIDRSLAGGWKTDEAMGGWWDNLSRLNPLLSEESKRVVVYLLPTLQTSQIAVGRKDMPKMAYANWRTLGNTQILTISIDWEEWESAGSGQREIRFAEFVATQLAEYWRVPNKDYEQELLKILRGETKAPVELISPVRRDK